MIMAAEAYDRLSFLEQSAILISMQKKRNWPSTRQSLLVNLHGDGKQNAWIELVSIYGPLIFRYARRKGLSPEDSEDITQEVLSRITRFSYDETKGRFRSWLATVSARQIRDRWEKIANAKRLPVAGEYEVESAPDLGLSMGEWDEIYFGRILQIACQRIRPEFDNSHWSVFEKLHLPGDEEKSNAAFIAKEMDKSIGWVYKTNHNITSRLKQVIKLLVDDSARFQSRIHDDRMS